MQGLSFQNLTNQTVWVILLYYDSSCGAANQNFRKQGWWKLNPGQTVVIWNVDLRTVNRYIYFEAEFDADKSVWGGNGNAWIEITDARDLGWSDLGEPGRVLSMLRQKSEAAKGRVND